MLIFWPSKTAFQLCVAPPAVDTPRFSSSAQRALGWLPTQSWLAAHAVVESCWQPPPALVQVYSVAPTQRLPLISPAASQSEVLYPAGQAHAADGSAPWHVCGDVQVIGVPLVLQPLASARHWTRWPPEVQA
jgi:hypothetical protein